MSENNIANGNSYSTKTEKINQKYTLNDLENINENEDEEAPRNSVPGIRNINQK